jgi:hypothetical protein
MSDITEEILAIELEINACFDNDLVIDPKKVKRLCELRVLRLKELVQTHDQRYDIMKAKTRELTAKYPRITSDQLKLHSSILDRIHEEQGKYDKAAIDWVIRQKSPWEDSEAFSIGAAILILFNEIC